MSELRVPRSCAFCKGGYDAADVLGFSALPVVTQFVFRKETCAHLAFTRTGPASPNNVEPITAPAPLLRSLPQPAFHRIPMHVYKLLYSLPIGPYVEVVEACLPEHSPPRFIREQVSLSRIAPFSLRRHCMRGALFQHLHYGRRASHLGFGDQQMKMLRHDHIADHHESKALARLFERREEAVGPWQNSAEAIADSRNK